MAFGTIWGLQGVQFGVKALFLFFFLLLGVNVNFTHVAETWISSL